MHVKDLHLSKQDREERGLFLRQKDKKAELVPKQNVNILKHCLSPFCLRVEKVCSSFQVIAYKCNYAIASSSHDICKHYLVKSKNTLVLSDVVKRPLNSNTSLPSRGLFNHRPALPYLPPPPLPLHSAPQPHPHPPSLLEHTLPLASVCKAVSSFQHFQQMYVELKPVSNSCVYKTLFGRRESYTWNWSHSRLYSAAEKFALNEIGQSIILQADDIPIKCKRPMINLDKYDNKVAALSSSKYGLPQ